MVKTFNYRSECRNLDAATRAGVPGQFVKLADGVVRYELAGPPDSDVVVLVPGFSVPYFVWDPTFAALTEAGFRVLRYDLYGRGYSDRPEVVYDLNLFDRQIVHLLAALGITGPINLIGLSMGGAIVATFAARHPEHIRRLILIDPLIYAPVSSSVVNLVFAPGFGERVMNWFGDRLFISNQGQDFYRTELISAYQEKYRPPTEYRGFRGAILSTLCSMPTWDITGSYERVGKCGYPVQLFWGREDKTIPFENHQKVRDAIPRVELQSIDAAGHVPHYERPEVVNPRLIEFLKR